MGRIDDIVAQIRTAIYGKDVRENIAEGIELCYEDAVSSDLHNSLENQAIEFDENDLAYVPLIKGLSAGGSHVDRRMSTNFLIIPGDFEVFIDPNDDQELISFNISIYDKDYVEIGDYLPTLKTETKQIWFVAASVPTAMFFKVWVCDYNNYDRDLTNSQIEYAKTHLFIRKGIKIISLSEYSSNDFISGRNAPNATQYALLDEPSRGSQMVFLRNDTSIYPISNTRPDKCDFYLSYFDNNFLRVVDSSWCNKEMYEKISNYPYIKLSFADHTDRTKPVSSALAKQYASYIRLDSPILYCYTVSVTGAISSVGNTRICERHKTYIKDGYIKCKHTSYSYDICIFDSAEDNVPLVKEYGWVNFASDYGPTDKAIRVQNKYVQLIFAKEDRTASITPAEYGTFYNQYVNGEIYEIIEGVDSRAIGDDIINGYPEYYNNEMTNTVNSAAALTTYNSVKFAMITDLHDNDQDHLSETVEKQIMAIRDLHRKNGLDFVICGGDFTDGSYSSKNELLKKFTSLTKAFKEIGVPVLMMRGNHDDNSYAGKTVAKVVTRQEFYARCIAPFSGKKINNNKNYYYQDFDDCNTRVIVLDFIDYPWVVVDDVVQYYAASGDGVWRGYSDDQIIWLITDALNCNKRIIVTGHYSTHPNLMTTWEKERDHNYTVVNDVMIAYNSRGSVTFGGNTYSFAGKTGKILCQVSGHSHAFGAFKDNGIVWSTTGSPSPEVTHRVYDDTQYETMGTRTYGDITEAHFNMFVCNDSAVHIISFGQMGDLDFDI